MAEGLLSGLTNWIDQRKQAAKSSVGLLADNPQEWLTQTTARYLPTRAEEQQYRSVQQAGGDITQTPYYQKLFDLAQFQSSLKPLSKTQFQVANEVAQKNAVEMLGLPPDNTAMDRAKAMGFDIENPVYHGTNYDIQNMNVKGKGKTSGAGAFVTNNPIVAETYVSGIGTPGGNIMPLLLKDKDLLTTNARGKNWNDIYTNQLSVKEGSKKYSLDDLGLDKNSATTTDELGMIVGNLGKKGIVIKNVKDVGTNSHIFRAKEYLKEKYGVYPNEDWSNVSGKQFDEARNYLDRLYGSQKSNVTAIQDPSLLRSKFAAFDPARANESDLLAAGIPIGLLGSTQVELPKKQEKKPTKK